MNDESAKKKVREDIRRYENQKTIKNLATVGGLGALGVTGASAFYRKPLPTALGLAGAFGGGFLRGKAKREEQGALNRIKKYYDLRERAPLINLSSVLPEREKTAVVGEVAHALSMMDIPLLHTSIAAHIPHWIQQWGPLGVEALALPAAAKGGKNFFQKMMNIAARAEAGKKLSANEKMLAGLAETSGGIAQKMHKYKGFGSGVTKYLSGYPGILAQGQDIGKQVGKGVKKLEQISPEHAQLVMDLMAGGETAKKATKELIRDKIQYQRALRDLSNLAGPKTKQEAENAARKIYENYASPEKASETVQGIKSLRNRLLSGAATTAIGGTAFGVGSLLGSKKKEHPLQRNELPSQLAEMQKSAFWNGFLKEAATINDMIGNPFGATPKPPPPPPPPPANVSTSGQTLNQMTGNAF